MTSVGLVGASGSNLIHMTDYIVVEWTISKTKNCHITPS